MNKEFGKHFLIELIDCDVQKIEYIDSVKEVFLEGARLSKATIISEHFHQFDPVGVSGVILIAESHFSIHTYPESRFCAFDIFTCGDMNPYAAIDYVKENFKAQDIIVREFARGF